MEIFRETDSASGAAIEALRNGSALTIGNFDGIHLGHREILARVHKWSGELKVPSVVMTFDPHPRKVLSSPAGLRLITDNRSKCGIFDMLEVDYMLIVEFTREFASLAPMDFIEKWLMPLSPRAIVVGYDFNFGRGGAGSLETLEKEGARSNFSVEMVPAYKVEGVSVSSSRIRNLIEAGEVAMAEKFLGRPFSVYGQVIKGHGRGRKLGFPTANINVAAELLPCDGVYAAEVALEDGVHAAMLNIGSNPTFEDMARSVEACILDFDRDMYGMEVEARFRERIRSEIKFPGPDALIEQINQDKKAIERFFQKHGKSSPLVISSSCKSV